MKLIGLLFFLQTLLITASYHFKFPVVLKIDLGALIYFIQINRLHQIINVMFLVSIWITGYKKIENMFYYLKTRQAVSSLLLFLLYIFLIFLYLEFLPKDYLYRRGFFIIVAAGIVGLPYLFPVDLIRNPYKYSPSDFSFRLKGSWGQHLPINSPETGIYILGGQGSGKTKSVIEPILYKMIKKGYSGILYDYDYHSEIHNKSFSLTHLAHHCIENFTNKNNKINFLSINFEDLTRTHRINPIASEYIKDREKLSQAIHSFLLNLNPGTTQKQDFWYNNTVALLKSVIVFLANKFPEYCTFPHAIQLGLQENEYFISAIASDPEARSYAGPILDAAGGSQEQFVGVISSLKIALDKLLSKNFAWVLSGENMLPIVNDPSSPWIVCLGNTPTKKDIIAPILAMLTSMMVSDMYAHGRNKSFVMIDELPTIVLPNLSDIPATARKYGISTVVALQNIPQLEDAYGMTGAQKIESSFANQFIGRGPLHSAKYLSDMMGKITKETTSTTQTDKKLSTTVHQKEELLITPQDAMSLPTGLFMGKVVDPSGGFFKMQLNPLEDYHKKLFWKEFKPLPIICETPDIDTNFTKIQNEVQQIVKIFKKN